MHRSFRLFLIGSILLLLVTIVLSGHQTALAQEGTGDRTREVEVTATQYVWQLITMGGQVVCETITNTSIPPDAQQAADLCFESVETALATSAPTRTAPQTIPTPFNFNSFLANSFWRLLETREIERTIEIELPDLIVYTSAPAGTVRLPYVILSAYEPATEFSIESIEGEIEERPFICQGSRCEVPLPLESIESTLTFWANSSDGSQSEHATATTQFVIVSAGYQVTVMDASYLQPYVDTCAQTWGITGSLPAWAGMPTSPDALNTYKTLHFLAAELINVGAVDARDCPGGGFVSAGAPNACGIERAQEAVHAWQNQFNTTIWTSGLSAGIPPRMIKAVLEQESQYWPGNELRYLNEYGMGQLSNWGADVALRWNTSLYQLVCSQLGINCDLTYAIQPSTMQSMLRGALLRAIDAECSNCRYGFDLAAAEQSIPVIAQTLYGNCRQADFIMKRHSTTAAYDTQWKFTMVSYHSGFTCLDNAVADAKSDGVEMSWDNVSSRLDCAGGKAYVDNLWLSLGSMAGSQPAAPQATQPVQQPTFVPRFTATPTTPPMPVEVSVQVYIDTNNNQRMDSGEGVDGIEVRIRFASGPQQVVVVEDGMVETQVVGPRIGERVTISVPDLYREIYALVDEDRTVNAVFRLQQPPLPTALP